MSNEELKPCPFCGGAARYVPADYVNTDGDPWPFAECDACSVGAPVENWSKRTQLEAIRAAGGEVAAPELPQFAQKVIDKLQRFDECAEDFESGGCDIGRPWFDTLTHLGLLERVQRSPALWQLTELGESLLEQQAEMKP